MMELDPTVFALAEQTADPAAVLHNLQDFTQHHPEWLPRLQQCLADAVCQRRLVLTLGNSPYLANVLRRWPECLPIPGAAPHHFLEANQTLLANMLATNSWAEAARLLRQYKHCRFFEIGSQDLSGEIALDTVVLAISQLADSCLEAGYQWLDRHLATRHGRPMIYNAAGKIEPASFVVLGMGKLGARELNFSSDVDLIYLFDAGQGEVEGSCSLHVKGYFNRLGRDLIRLLGESTAEGQVFRIDLRLRPEGESGELAPSRRSAELYYESWGQTWERSAMIKARPVAGNLALGDDFLQWLQPFVFRRYLDFAAVDAIREMKLKIDRKVTLTADYHRNIKLGYGGIREIEFFVQSQQLIHGGKHPTLRPRETLVALHNLCEGGWLQQETGQFLATAYRFLRTLEHRLQIQHDQQLHSIPEDPTAFAQLSKRMGIPHAAELRLQLTAITTGVHTIYKGLFLSAEQKHQEASNPLVDRLFACEPGEEICQELLRSAGFNDLEQAGTLVRIVRDGPQRHNLTEWMRVWYRRLAVPLLQEILQAPDQDMAIHHAENFLGSLGHRVSYLALLLENPPVLKILVRLFGTSVLLSHYFIRHPELMDRLVTRDFFQQYRSRGELANDLATLLQDATNTEERFNIVREFKNGETLRIGVRDLSKAAEPIEVMAGLSALADVILAQVLADALAELQTRHGTPNVPFVILAMGKLGGRELNYASDLDLIFLHGGQGEEQWTDGANPISVALFFTRLGQKIITGITTLTRAGKLYELDMRLRPSGNSGTLVTSVQAFLQYQRTDAWVWEHQALSRARVVAGDPDLANDLRQEIRRILQQPRQIETLRQEVVQMRLRMFADKKPAAGWIDIKQSRGGIVDIEFMTQFLILAFANQYPEIVQNNTAKALQACKMVGLLDTKTHNTLETAYELLRLLENRLRLLHGRSENRIGPSLAIREQLRRLCDLPDDTDVVTVVTAQMQAVVPIFQSILEGVTPFLPANHSAGK